ncbi:PH domain-containing protein [Salana multivorans]
MSDRPGPDLSPIRPRWAPVVGAVLAVIVVASVVVLFAFVRPNAATELGLADYVLVVFVAGILLGILWRQSTVSATPSPEGLAVRNLMGTTRLEWAQIVSVRFSPDRAWAQLDLADGDQLAVMAIQSADGERARHSAQRLASLVTYYGTAPDAE